MAISRRAAGLEAIHPHYDKSLKYNWETGHFDNDVAEYDPAPPDCCQYGLDRFWDERYFENPSVFEWYHDYHALKGLLEQFCDKEQNICLVGCGTSEMAADMHADGYKSVMNLDMSRICIDQMQTRYKDISGPPVSLKKIKMRKGKLSEKDFPALVMGQDLGGVQWRQGNACDMSATFDDQIFDVVIDKALLDSLYCAQKPQKQVKAYLQEVDRILKPLGIYFCVSHGLPETRLDKLENTDEESEEFLAWFCEVHAVPKNEVNPYKVSQLKDPNDVYYVYTCSKDEKQRSVWKSNIRRPPISSHHCVRSMAWRFKKISRNNSQDNPIHWLFPHRLDNEKCMAIASKKARAKAAAVAKTRVKSKTGGLKKKKKKKKGGGKK